METIDRFPAHAFARMEELGVLYSYDTIKTLFASTTSLVEALPAVKMLSLVQAPVACRDEQLLPHGQHFAEPLYYPLHVYFLNSPARSVPRVHDHVPKKNAYLTQLF